RAAPPARPRRKPPTPPPPSRRPSIEPDKTMTDAAPPPSAPAAPPAPPPPSSGRRVMWSVALIAMAVVGISLILHAWRLPPFSGGPQTTDDAYVRGHVTIISPQVSGDVTSVEVQDFQAA